MVINKKSPPAPTGRDTSGLSSDKPLSATKVYHRPPYFTIPKINKGGLFL